MAAVNSNLHKAKATKNDEFYTTKDVVNDELEKYTHHFKGKTIFLNCDDDKKSEFFRYLERNMASLGISKLIGLSYKEEGRTYKTELTLNEDNSVSTLSEGDDGSLMRGNGDFRSEESIELLKQSDIVITNPPFSLFREFVSLMEEHNKQYLILGSLNAASYQEIFPLIRDKKLWLGVNNGSKLYKVPSDYEHTNVKEKNGVRLISLGNTVWYTNLEHGQREEDLTLRGAMYNPIDNPVLDDTDFIEVSNIKKIPGDYHGVMAVPVSFLTKCNRTQFDLIGVMATTKITDTNFGYPKINGKKKFARLLIKRNY